VIPIPPPETPRAPGIYEIAWDDAGRPTDWEVEPYSLGPVWTKADDDWIAAGKPVDPEGYILPELTLGWQAIHWVEHNLLADEVDENDKPLPFSFTAEQMRVVLWFYAISEAGYFLYREYVLQRLKGWGRP
jgi:hypothetical protein